MQAWDPLNQKLKWNVEGGGGIGGGTTTTAGNIVFQTINDGRFRAVRADNGEISPSAVRKLTSDNARAFYGI